MKLRLLVEMDMEAAGGKTETFSDRVSGAVASDTREGSRVGRGPKRPRQQHVQGSPGTRDSWKKRVGELWARGSRTRGVVARGLGWLTLAGMHQRRNSQQGWMRHVEQPAQEDVCRCPSTSPDVSGWLAGWLVG